MAFINQNGKHAMQVQLPIDHPDQHRAIKILAVRKGVKVGELVFNALMHEYGAEVKHIMTEGLDTDG